MPRYSFTRNGYSGTGWSETGEENIAAANDVDPEMKKKINEAFRRRGLPDKYPTAEEAPVQKEPASEHPRAQEEIA